MFKYIFQFTIIIMLNTALAFEVQNIVSEQSTDGEHILIVTYDLTGDEVFVTFQVIAEISIDGGDNWNHIDITPIPNVYGDNIFPGTDKTFQIDLDDYYSNIYTNSALVKIEAIGHEAITLPSWMEMISVPEGPYLHKFIGDYGEDLGIQTIDYDYEIGKYTITNSQYAAWLIELYNNDMICVSSSGNMGEHTTFVRGAFDGYGFVDPMPGGTPGFPGDCSHMNSYIYFANYNATGYKVRFNGNTFIVDEGFGNHPVTGVTLIGAMSFARYYGLRLPYSEEWIKASRGTNDWDFVWGAQDADYNSYGGNADLSRKLNYRYFSNPWDLLHDDVWGSFNTNSQNDATTPVGYFNGTTYQYPEGLHFPDFSFDGNGGVNYIDTTIYYLETDDTQSLYGCYDMNGNVEELTQSPLWQWNGSDWFHVMNGNYDHPYMSSALLPFRSKAEDDRYTSLMGFRVARTVNTASSTSTSKSSSKIK